MRIIFDSSIIHAKRLLRDFKVGCIKKSNFNTFIDLIIQELPEVKFVSFSADVDLPSDVIKSGDLFYPIIYFFASENDKILIVISKLKDEEVRDMILCNKILETIVPIEDTRQIILGKIAGHDVEKNTKVFEVSDSAVFKLQSSFRYHTHFRTYKLYEHVEGKVDIEWNEKYSVVSISDIKNSKIGYKFGKKLLEILPHLKISYYRQKSGKPTSELQNWSEVGICTFLSKLLRLNKRRLF